MLNYLSAELWRMSRRRIAWLGWALFLILTALAGLLWGMANMAEAMEAFADLLLLGVYLVYPLAAWADGEASRGGQLRNEAAFGLPRTRIYLGKLWAALIAGLALFLLTAAVFFGATIPLVGGAPVGEEALLFARAYLIRETLIALPRYVGALSLAYLLCTAFRMPGLGAVLFYLYITFGELTLAAIEINGLGLVGALLDTFARAVRPYLLTGAFISYGDTFARPGVAVSWATGLLWLVFTSAAGLFLFRRREIRS